MLVHSYSISLSSGKKKKKQAKIVSTFQTKYPHTSVNLTILSELKHAQFCCLVCGLPAPWKLLPHVQSCLLVEFSHSTVTKSLKEAVVDLLNWDIYRNNVWLVLISSTLGIVNNSNNT